MSECNKSNISTGYRKAWVNVRTGKFEDESPFATEITERKSAIFHTWCKQYPCAIGDGSIIQERTLAVVEMYDGKIEYFEPHHIQFDKNYEN